MASSILPRKRLFRDIILPLLIRVVVPGIFLGLVVLGCAHAIHLVFYVKANLSAAFWVGASIGSFIGLAWGIAYLFDEVL